MFKVDICFIEILNLLNNPNKLPMFVIVLLYFNLNPIFNFDKSLIRSIWEEREIYSYSNFTIIS